MDLSIVLVMIMAIILYVVTLIDQALKSKKSSGNNDNFYSETKTLEMPIYDSRENH